MSLKSSLKLRKPLKTKNQVIVIKLSSLAVTNETGGINQIQLGHIIHDISRLIYELKLKIVIVSSGAINAGRSYFKKNSEKKEIAYLQACSAIGQPRLMQAFQNELEKYHLNCAQVLLTHEDCKNKNRSHNVRQCLLTLIENGIIPIINENDTVSFDEITVGDNDQLSAMICENIQADILCLLTLADGLYDRDPALPNAVHFPLINYSDTFSEIQMITKSSAGRGGMKTKIQAIRKLTPLGINVILSSFKFETPILRSLVGESGTLFLGNPDQSPIKKKAWILTRVRIDAIIKVDLGAKDALKKNASLLPIGVTGVSGKFNRGDCVQIQWRNEILAYGISEYSSKEIDKIKGVHSSQLQTILSTIPSKVVIHKDNLILNEGYTGE